jgi:hypothetical protein
MKKNAGRKLRRNLSNENRKSISDAKQRLDANRHKPYNNK